MSASRHYVFGPYSIDPARRLLARGSDPVPLTARAFDVLLALLERHGETVEKDDLLRRVWPDTIVQEANLSQQIFTIRKLLGQCDDRPYIATVPRRGYRFVADVVETRGTHAHAAAQVTPPPRPASALRLSIPLETTPLAPGPTPTVAIAPDGSCTVYVATVGGVTRLFQRAMSEFSASEIGGTEGASSPFFSPDGEWVGFHAGRRLRKVSLAGGPPLALCDLTDLRGASWGRSGTIVFAPGPTSGLWKIDATGGTATPLTSVQYEDGERTHRWPHVLPDGSGVVFTVGHAGAASFDEASLAVVDLRGGPHRLIVRHATDGRCLATGHLAWTRGGVLLAAPFDLAARQIRTSGRPVQAGIATAATGVAHFAISDNGTLVHVPGQAQTLRRSLVGVDRSGNADAPYVAGEALEEPRVSRDGRSVILSARGQRSDLWLFEFARAGLTRATFEGENFAGIWGPDDEWLTFSSSRRGGASDLYVVRPDGPAPPALLIAGEFDKVPGSWSADGSALLFTEYHPETGADLWLLDRTAERARPFIRTPFNEYTPTFSPDGRLVAYTTDASGRPEIHIVSYPDATCRRQLSTEGGAEPVWSRNGHELFYRSGDRLMRVDMRRGPGDAGVPTTMFEGKFACGTVTLSNYDVMPDGSSFLMVRPDAIAHPTALFVTLNWFTELA